MAGLFDFLQSASNAVAGNVTGPVDLLTLALQKAGVPVPNNAVGSSQWAREKGLLRDVEQGPARIAGETFGLLAPTVVAAKAPQIAGGILKMADNAAAPNVANVGGAARQRGMFKFPQDDALREAQRNAAKPVSEGGLGLRPDNT